MAKRQTSSAHTAKTRTNDVAEQRQQSTSGRADTKASRVAEQEPAKQTKKTVVPTHDQISERAKAIWRERGCVAGEDQSNWFEAERQLQKEMSRT
jgi:hypothetical protein